MHTVLGFWNVVAFFALQTLAILALPSGLASVLIYLQPLLVAILAWRLLGESMGAAKVVGLVIGFAGIVLVSTGALGGHISTEGVAYAVVGAWSGRSGRSRSSATRTRSTTCGRWRSRSSAAESC